jgi:hypothetical protein
LAESWFSLSRKDQAEALEVASASTGRAPHLLEKDIWVVWALAAIYACSFAEKLTFKGGTSLSKVYKIIDRFSEDIDLTYDIRELVPNLLEAGNPLPIKASQAKKMTDAVRRELPEWIQQTVKPELDLALNAQGLEAQFLIVGSAQEKLLLNYQPLRVGSGYTASSIQLEFGGRATGEPHHRQPVVCDVANSISGISFPEAMPLVMSAERTFWEKATAAHVYCQQAKLKGQRYSRHWYDLAAMVKSGHAKLALLETDLAQNVAMHKSMFFSEKNADHLAIDYLAAVRGAIQLVPKGEALGSLKEDYMAMLSDGLLSSYQPAFEEIMEICDELEQEINLK